MTRRLERTARSYPMVRLLTDTSMIDLGHDRALTFDMKKGRLSVRNQAGEFPVFAMTADTFFGFVDELDKTFESGASLILEKAGEGAGLASARRAKSWQDPEKAINGIFNRASMWGHGKYELVSFDFRAKYARLRVHDCFFARESDSDGRSMWYIRGYFKGYFSSMFGDESIVCEELKCASRGDKYCEFESAERTINPNNIFASNFFLATNQNFVMIVNSCSNPT